MISDNLPDRAMNSVGRFPVATHCFHSQGLSRSLRRTNLGPTTVRESISPVSTECKSFPTTVRE